MRRFAACSVHFFSFDESELKIDRKLCGSEYDPVSSGTRYNSEPANVQLHTVWYEV